MNRGKSELRRTKCRVTPGNRETQVPQVRLASASVASRQISTNPVGTSVEDSARLVTSFRSRSRIGVHRLPTGSVAGSDDKRANPDERSGRDKFPVMESATEKIPPRAKRGARVKRQGKSLPQKW